MGGDLDCAASPAPSPEARTFSVRLLPNLLPNAVGRARKETEGERLDTQDVPLNRSVLGCTGDGARRSQ